MTSRRKRDLRNRILSANGHMRAIAEMINTDVPCAEILRQLQAVRGAMRAIRRTLWRTYLFDSHCGLHARNRKFRMQTFKRLWQVIAADRNRSRATRGGNNGDG